MNKSKLVAGLQDEYRQWQTLLDQIGIARMDQPGVAADWSIKDIVAHMTLWNIKLVTDMQAALAGEPEPAPPWSPLLKTEDEINAWIYESNRNKSVRQVLDESKQVFQQLFTVVNALPDDVQIEPHTKGERAYPLVWLGNTRFQPGEFFEHLHDDHERDIRTWLDRQEKS